MEKEVQYIFGDQGQSLARTAVATLENLMSRFKIPFIEEKKTTDEFITAYSLPGRYYHTTEHIGHVIKELKKADPEVPSYVYVAALYHDYVYNPRRSDNEERSADYIVKKIEQYEGSRNLQDKVSKLIRATKHTGKFPENVGHYGKLLVDADMSILGQPYDVYLRYAHAVRKEYALYGTHDYIEGRLKFLMGQLSTSKVFMTQEFEGYERPARDNMTMEVSLLLGCKQGDSRCMPLVEIASGAMINEQDKQVASERTSCSKPNAPRELTRDEETTDWTPRPPLKVAEKRDITGHKVYHRAIDYVLDQANKSKQGEASSWEGYRGGATGEANLPDYGCRNAYWASGSIPNVHQRVSCPCANCQLP